MPMITVKDITKDYGNNKGVFDLSFSVEKGEVFGFLGPNGAGKTTTIRHLLGFLTPEKGSCSIGGMDCRTDSAAIQQTLGYLPGEIAFFDEMTGMEFLKFMGKMRKMSDDTMMKKLIDYFQLDASGKIKKMSKGMKQKIAIVCAFMHDPSTLILDEPTSGLDPLMQSKFISLILEEKERGKTILMSSHSFEEVEKTCDRIGIIRSGRLVADATVEELKKAQRKIYAVSFLHHSEADAFAAEDLTVLSNKHRTVTVSVNGNITPLIQAMNRHPVSDLAPVAQSLEEIFMSYYGGERHV